MRYPVVELRLIWIGLRVGLRYTFGDDLLVALLMAHVLAVGALVTSRVLEETTTKGAAHDVEELLLDKLVSILLVNIFFALTDGTFAVQTQIEWSPVFGLLDCQRVNTNLNRRTVRY